MLCNLVFQHDQKAEFKTHSKKIYIGIYKDKFHKIGITPN